MMEETTQGERVTLPQPNEIFLRARSLGKFFRCMAFFGPAAIVASASVGAGETVLAVRTGAWSGYGLLWLILLASLTKQGFLQYSLGRYTAVTGEYVGDAWARLPGPRGWFLWFIMVIEVLMAPFFVSAISGACGGLISAIIGGGDPRLWGTLFTVGAIGLGLGVSYEKLELQQVLICIVLVAGTLVGASFAAPSIGDILKGTLSFGHIPDYPAWLLSEPDFVGRSKGLELATVFGYIGGVMGGYVVYTHWITLHGWGMNGSPQIEEIREKARRGGITYLPTGHEALQRMRHLLAPLKYDVGLGTFVLFFVSAAFLIAGAAIMNPLHMMPGGYLLLSKQKAIWEQISPIMVPVYYVSILAALWGTLYALPEIYARIAHEFLGVLFKKMRGMAYRRMFIYLGVYVLIVSSFILWTGIKPVTMMDIAAAISTNIGITLVTLGSIWLNYQLPKPYRLGRAMLILLLVTAVVLAAVSSVSVATLWAKYVG